MTIFESNYSPPIEVNGVSFRLEVQSVIPVPILPFTEISFRLGFQATNNTSEPLYFERVGSLEIFTTPILIDSQGLQRRVDGSDLLRLWVDSGPPYYIIRPGENGFFPLESRLFRKIYQLHCKIYTENGGFMYFLNLKRGKHQIQFIYRNSERIRCRLTPEEEASVRSWSGRVVFPFVEFQIG